MKTNLNEKLQNFNKGIISNRYAISIILILLITGIALFINYTNRLTNTIISVIPGVTTVQKTDDKKLNDSIRYKEQSLLLAETKAQVKQLQSTLQLALATQMKAKEIALSVETKAQIVYPAIPNNPVEQHDYFNNNTNTNKNDYPLKFKHEFKLIKEWYTVHSKDSATIDSLKIELRNHIIVAETGKWYQKKTLKIGLSDENPYFIIDSIQSISYHPKPKIQISIGPVLLTNGKSTSFGVGATIKKGIFSFTLGYQIF